MFIPDCRQRGREEVQIPVYQALHCEPELLGSVSPWVTACKVLDRRSEAVDTLMGRKSSPEPYVGVRRGKQP